jgi:hypothetical protein
MSNDFMITYKGSATGHQLAAVEKALKAIGPGPVDQDGEDSCFYATLDWGITRKDCNNLMGKLNLAANIVIAVNEGSFGDRKVAMDTKFWNRAFTDVIRQTTQTAWGNWSLNAAIVPGAVGIVDPGTGSFTPVATLPGADIDTVNLVAPAAWAIESSSVRKNESEVEFAGGYMDPSSGLEVKVGLNVAWSFAREGSIVSNATLSGQSMINDFGVLMQQQFDWLQQRARSVGYASKDGIIQGFGVITHVRLCSGGVNIGSLNDNSTFSLTGSVDGIDAMTGGGEVSATVKGSYKETNESKAFEHYMWPASVNTAAPHDLAISYQFATFHGKLIMPTWIERLGGLRIIFDNAHGGTYIAHCKVEYTVTGAPDQITQEKTVPGGQVQTIDGIPLEAIDLAISIHFTAGDDFHFPFPLPVSSWLTGQCTIDLSGVWPWGSKAVVREVYKSL